MSHHTLGRCWHSTGALWALLLSLGLLSLTWPGLLRAQEEADADLNPERHELQRGFETVRREWRASRTSLPEFLLRSVNDYSAHQLHLLGTENREWLHGGDQPELYRAFEEHSAFAPSFGQLLPALEALLEKSPKLNLEAPWLSLLARAQLDAGQHRRAWHSARRAWRADRRLCDQKCSPILRQWLNTGTLSKPAQWAPIAVPRVYRATVADCLGKPRTIAEQRPPIWQIPDAELVRSLLGPKAHVTWMLRQAWLSHLNGCDNIPFRLRESIDQLYNEEQIRLAWSRLQRSLITNPRRANTFLGLSVVLPALECDYARDPTCMHFQKPLSTMSAMALADGLRAFTRRLGSETHCSVLDEAAELELREQQARLREALQDAEVSLESLPFARRTDALGTSLQAILSDPDYAPVWRNDIPIEVQSALADIARGGAPDAAERALGALFGVAGASLQNEASMLELRALVLLRQRRPKQALLALTEAQAGDAALRRSHRIAQLRAALAGADLKAPFAHAEPRRPWIVGDESSEHEVSKHWPEQTSGSLDGVLLEDLEFAMGGQRALARGLLQRLWVPWLLGWHGAREDLPLPFSLAYNEREFNDLAAKLPGQQDAAQFGPLTFDGVLLQIPDRVCADPDCEHTLAVDADWVKARLFELYAEGSRRASS